MLRAKIYVNEKQIDDIQIINTGKKYDSITEYKVTAIPCDYYIHHRRKDGWEVLLIKALEVKSHLELPSFMNIDKAKTNGKDTLCRRIAEICLRDREDEIQK